MGLVYIVLHLHILFFVYFSFAFANGHSCTSKTITAYPPNYHEHKENSHKYPSSIPRQTDRRKATPNVQISRHAKTGRSARRTVLDPKEVYAKLSITDTRLIASRTYDQMPRSTDVPRYRERPTHKVTSSLDYNSKPSSLSQKYSGHINDCPAVPPLVNSDSRLIQYVCSTLYYTDGGNQSCCWKPAVIDDHPKEEDTLSNEDPNDDPNDDYYSYHYNYVYYPYYRYYNYNYPNYRYRYPNYCHKKLDSRSDYSHLRHSCSYYNHHHSLQNCPNRKLHSQLDEYIPQSDECIPQLDEYIPYLCPNFECFPTSDQSWGLNRRHSPLYNATDKFAGCISQYLEPLTTGNTLVYTRHDGVTTTRELYAAITTAHWGYTTGNWATRDRWRRVTAEYIIQEDQIANLTDEQILLFFANHDCFGEAACIKHCKNVARRTRIVQCIGWSILAVFGFITVGISFISRASPIFISLFCCCRQRYKGRRSRRRLLWWPTKSSTFEERDDDDDDDDDNELSPLSTRETTVITKENMHKFNFGSPHYPPLYRKSPVSIPKPRRSTRHSHASERATSHGALKRRLSLADNLYSLMRLSNDDKYEDSNNNKSKPSHVRTRSMPDTILTWGSLRVPARPKTPPAKRVRFNLDGSCAISSDIEAPVGVQREWGLKGDPERVFWHTNIDAREDDHDHGDEGPV